jgi:hypothetical protein
LDIYPWGTGLALTERIHDIGQKFYSLLFKQEVVATPSYFQIFFLIAFLDEAFIINIIIILCIKYIIIICINDNNAVINNNYGRLKTLFCSSKFPWARERISLKFMDTLGTRQKRFACPALTCF